MGEARYQFWKLKINEGGGLAVDCDDLIYVGYWNTKKIRIFTPLGGNAIREISCGGYEPWQIFVMASIKMLVVGTQDSDIRLLDQQGKEVYSVANDCNCDTCALYVTVCKDGTIIIANINDGRDRVNVKQYTSELKYVKTLITDHVIEKTEMCWYYLREFSSGELALCTSERLYIFHKTVSPPEELLSNF